jgi:3-deoxy-manno-octulosonate cytidylyltransferase (CMP-KDO synthetase)
MRTLAVIPSRYASTRLPGKPLLVLGGRTVIQRVWDATTQSGEFDRVVVATDDERIVRTVDGFGGEAVMTSDQLSNGSERTAAAAALVETGHEAYDVVANVQGDQPFVSSDALSALMAPYRNQAQAGTDGPDMTTVAVPLDPGLADDPNTVKVVTAVDGRALYFSRSRIPADPRGGGHAYLQHLGIYAFRRSLLAAYPSLAPTPLEKVESLEQLRCLEHGYDIVVTVAESSTLEINTPEDYERAKAFVSSRATG